MTPVLSNENFNMLRDGPQGIDTIGCELLLKSSLKFKPGVPHYGNRKFQGMNAEERTGFGVSHLSGVA